MHLHDILCVAVHVQTYLPWCDTLTHEDLVVGSKLWGVVIHIFHFDVNTHFGVLVKASYTQTWYRPK